jgi:hypothetical protein
MTADIHHSVKPDAERLATVAEIYLEACDASEWPTKSVAESLGVPYQRAKKLVLAARQMGLIPPTTQGQSPRKPRRCPTCGAMPSRWTSEP